MSKVLIWDSLPAKNRVVFPDVSKMRECGAIYASVVGLMSGYEARICGLQGERRRMGREAQEAMKCVV